MSIGQKKGQKCWLFLGWHHWELPSSPPIDLGSLAQSMKSNITCLGVKMDSDLKPDSKIKIGLFPIEAAGQNKAGSSEAALWDSDPRLWLQLCLVCWEFSGSSVAQNAAVHLLTQKNDQMCLLTVWLPQPPLRGLWHLVGCWLYLIFLILFWQFSVFTHVLVIIRWALSRVFSIIPAARLFGPLWLFAGASQIKAGLDWDWRCVWIFLPELLGETVAQNTPSFPVGDL